MLPWSVIPIAGICSRFASASIGETFAAPSNIEYSVWLCRCTNDLLIGTPVYDRAPTSTRRVAKCVLPFRRITTELPRPRSRRAVPPAGRPCHWRPAAGAGAAAVGAGSGLGCRAGRGGGGLDGHQFHLPTRTAIAGTVIVRTTK